MFTLGEVTGVHACCKPCGQKTVPTIKDYLCCMSKTTRELPCPQIAAAKVVDVVKGCYSVVQKCTCCGGAVQAAAERKGGCCGGSCCGGKSCSKGCCGGKSCSGGSCCGGQGALTEYDHTMDPLEREASAKNAPVGAKSAQDLADDIELSDDVEEVRSRDAVNGATTEALLNVIAPPPPQLSPSAELMQDVWQKVSPLAGSVDPRTGARLAELLVPHTLDALDNLPYAQQDQRTTAQDFKRQYCDKNIYPECEFCPYHTQAMPAEDTDLHSLFDMVREGINALLNGDVRWADQIFSCPGQLAALIRKDLGPIGSLLAPVAAGTVIGLTAMRGALTSYTSATKAFRDSDHGLELERTLTTALRSGSCGTGAYAGLVSDVLGAMGVDARDLYVKPANGRRKPSNSGSGCRCPGRGGSGSSSRSGRGSGSGSGSGSGGGNRGTSNTSPTILDGSIFEPKLTDGKKSTTKRDDVTGRPTPSVEAARKAEATVKLVDDIMAIQESKKAKSSGSSGISYKPRTPTGSETTYKPTKDRKAVIGKKYAIPSPSEKQTNRYIKDKNYPDERNTVYEISKGWSPKPGTPPSPGTNYIARNKNYKVLDVEPGEDLRPWEVTGGQLFEVKDPVIKKKSTAPKIERPPKEERADGRDKYFVDPPKNLDSITIPNTVPDAVKPKIERVLRDFEQRTKIPLGKVPKGVSPFRVIKDMLTEEIKDVFPPNTANLDTIVAAVVTNIDPVLETAEILKEEDPDKVTVADTTIIDASLDTGDPIVFSDGTVLEKEFPTQGAALAETVDAEALVTDEKIMASQMAAIDGIGLTVDEIKVAYMLNQQVNGVTPPEDVRGEVIKTILDVIHDDYF